MTGRKDTAWLAGLVDTLTEVGEFLRSPAGHAALEDFYACGGSRAAGFNAGYLIDSAGFTALWLRSQAAQQAPRS